MKRKSENKKLNKFHSELFEKIIFDTVVSVEMSLLLTVLFMLLLHMMLPLLAVVVMVLLPSFVSFEAFIKLIVGLLAKTAGGGGNVVGNCPGWDIVTPVALFAIYIEFAAYIAFGRAKSIYFHWVRERNDKTHTEWKTFWKIEKKQSRKITSTTILISDIELVIFVS